MKVFSRFLLCAGQFLVCIVLGTTGSLAEAKCTDPLFRKCPVACVSLCDSEEFLRGNAILCSVGINQTRKDPPECAKLVMGPSSGVEVGGSAGSVGATDCSELPVLDRKICEAGFPSCAGRVPTLKKNAELLASEMRRELAKYGDILASDFKAKSPEDLCKFRIEDLRRFYEQASGQPGNLLSFSERAREMQACVKQVEAWFDRSSKGADLRGAILDSMKSDVDNLQAVIRDTNLNVKRIGEVAPILENLIVMHTFTCPDQSNATP
jgi:hypothetical protein